MSIKVYKAVPYRRVADMAASLKFYGEVLGYRVMQSLEQDGHVFWAQLRNGGSDVMISDRPVHDRESLTWLYVDDADAAYRTIGEMDCTPLGEPRDEPHGNREFLVKDPDGDVYVIAHDLRRPGG